VTLWYKRKQENPRSLEHFFEIYITLLEKKNRIIRDLMEVLVEVIWRFWSYPEVQVHGLFV